MDSLQEDDIIFVRSDRVLRHRLVALYGGISHVAVVVNHDDKLRVLSMGIRGVSLKTPSKFLAKWDHVRIIRPPTTPSATRKKNAHRTWNYCFSKDSSTCTFCTRHVREQLVSMGHHIPFFWHPYNMFLHMSARGTVVYSRGKEYDIWFTTMMLISLIILCIAIFSLSSRPHDKGGGRTCKSETFSGAQERPF